MIREVPDQKPTGSCADSQSEQEDHKKIADLQSKQEYLYEGKRSPHKQSEYF